MARFDDLAFAVQLLGSTRDWLSARDIEDDLIEQRAMRAAAAAERAGGSA